MQIKITGFILLGVILMSCITSAAYTPANAQETLRIAAVVNEGAISAYDLLARIRLIVTMSRLPKTKETINRLKGDTLRVLIDENLKLQEAETRGFNTTQEEIEAAIALIEQRNKMSPGQLPSILNSSGIDIETLLQQIRSSILWPKVVMSKYASTVDVSDAEVDSAVAKAEAAQELPVFLISEIIIPLENVAQHQEAEKQVQRLINNIQQGADFAALARSFSQSPSSKNGGDAGWIRQDQLPNEIISVISGMRPGQISQPIRLETSIALIHLRDYKANSRKQMESPTLNLSQVHLALPADAPENTVATYMESVRKNTTGTNDCESFLKSAAKISSPISGSLGDIQQSKLPAHLLKAVGTLKAGIPS
ncbi:MAG: hypothetical protein HON65_09510, partial [Rhodospirillales bacterium]|nr:hypothetical protein [Rhodospirillales bacterium]